MLERRVARPAWAPDGRAIYYAGSEGGSGVTSFTINAVDVESGRARALASLTGWNTGGKQVRTSVDPSVVYFAIANADGSLQYTVYRVPSGGGTIEALATNVGRPWFVISRSGNRVSYQAPRYDSDTIQVLTLSGSEEGATLSIPTAVNLPRVLAISPDGAIVVYGDDTAVYGAPVDGGAHLQLWRSPASASPAFGAAVASQVTWEGATPHLLVASTAPANDGLTVAIHDVDGVTAAGTLVGTIVDVVTGPWTLARSPDGSSFAAWVPVAVVNENIERTTYRFRLYVQTPRTGGPRALLDWTADEPLNWLEFSPDGSRLGLVLYGELYVLDMEH